MKNSVRKFILYSLVIFPFVFNACTKDTYIEQKRTQSYRFTVDPKSWVEINAPLGSQGYGFRSEQLFPEITNDVMINGSVNLFIEIDGTLEPLPLNVYFKSKEGVPYQGRYTYWFKAGRLFIEYYESDFNTGKPTNPLNFKLVIIQ